MRRGIEQRAGIRTTGLEERLVAERGRQDRAGTRV